MVKEQKQVSKNTVPIMDQIKSHKYGKLRLRADEIYLMKRLNGSL